MMKKITLLLALLTISFGYSQNLPLDFSTAAQLGTNGEGAVSSIVKDGENDVLQIVGANNAWDHAKFTFTKNVDLSDDANNTITFKIKPVNDTGNGSHLLKFEGGTGGSTTELPFTTTGTEWQTISLDFGSGLGNYSSLVLFTDAGDANAFVSDTYWVDDIAGGTLITPAEKPNLPLDFSTANQLGTVGDGATSSIVKDGDNDVLQIVGANHAWDHAKFEFKDAVDLSDDTKNTITFKIKPVNGTGSGNHLFKFEGRTDGPAATELPYTTSGTEWQTITLDFPAGLGSYPTLIFFVDSGDANAGVSDTYWVDDISIGATVVGTDATLSDLTVSGSSIAGFDANTLNYTVEVAEGATEVPTVTATATDSGATAVVTAATSLPGDTTVEVTAADGTTIKTYTVSFKYPITFPFDFEGSSTNWTGDGGSTVSVSANGELEIVGNGSDWDNAQVIFTSPVDLSDDDKNTLRFTFQSTTAEDGEVHQHGISFTETANGAGGNYEVNFQTTGKEVANIELDFEAGLGTSKKFVIFTDVGDLGAGAIKATPNVNGLADAGKKSGTYIVDNITLGATVLSIKNNSVLDFSMYPNPTSNMLNISAKETIQDTQIFNVLGKNVMSVKVNNSKASIDVSNLATGIYLVKYSVNGTIGTAKFVKK
jgi:hypothetical protein